MKKQVLILLMLVLATFFLYSCKKSESQNPIVTDFSTTELNKIPVEWINKAKENLHIAYGHTSHGSQITDGMTGLESFIGEPYLWNNGPMEGQLDIRDRIMGGDLGSNGDLAWEGATRTLLSDSRMSDINVVIWSWCGGVSSNTEEGINTYLNAMNQLEIDYPDVKFVYMTGHLDGTGKEGNLHIRNEQIREFCKNNNKYLYDFAAIESYDPDGNYYLDKAANDGCYYDSNGDGTRDANWAIDWQNSHKENVDWYQCNAAHSQALNANMKAYAAWWLWARLAGWSGK